MPGTRLGVIVGQVRAAIRHLVAMAPDLDADAARLTVSGHSAGAHLASYLAATGPEEHSTPDLPALRGLLLVSGIYDLADIPGCFLKDEAQMTPAEASAWSPLHSHHYQGPRRIVMLSEMDTAPFQTQGRQFASLLDNKGLDAAFRIEAGLNHLSIVLAMGNPESAAGCCISDMVSN